MISSERLAQLQKATEQDPVMQTLKTTILTGWPTEREEVPVHKIREFWAYRDELTLHNGVLFKDQRLIIPKALRTELTSRIHSSHLGIEACLRKARDLHVVFWPSMNAEIKEAVTNCSICAEFQAKQQKQPMQSHKIPDKNVKTLPELDIGQDVRVAGQPGKCLEKLSDRSYLVQTDRETVRRNREDLRPWLDADKATSTAPSPIPEEAKSAGEADTTKPQTPATPHPSMAKRTSSRTVKPPARFKDYLV